MKNKVILGDALVELKNIANESVDLIYLDPTFFTQKKHQLKTRDNLRTFQFDDKWDNLSDYLNMIRSCCIEFKRILKKTGSVFFHCDKNASHHIRVILDQIFGEDNFRNEIIWHYKRWSNGKKGLLSAHQTIFFYSKTDGFKFKEILCDYSPTTNVDQILQKRTRNEHNKSVYAKDEDGNVVIDALKKGVPLPDVWEIPFLNPKAKERTGYPTQKPIILLERIIKLVTNEGDIVLDPFCGSGTTIIAAKLLNRDYIGIDISSEAIKLTNNRLKVGIKTESNLLKNGKESYMELPEYVLSLLKYINSTPVQRNSGIDGFLKITLGGKPIPIRVQRHEETLMEAKSKLLKSAQSQNSEFKILIRTSLKDQLSLNEQNTNVLIIDSYDFIIKKELSKKINVPSPLTNSTLLTQ